MRIAQFGASLPIDLSSRAIKQPALFGATAPDRFTPQFGARQKVEQENLHAVQNTVSQEDLDALMKYYDDARAAGQFFRYNAHGLRVETTNVEGWIKVKDGKIVKIGWLEPSGAPVSKQIKNIFKKQLQAMTDEVHGNMSKVADGMYGTVAVTQEYTFAPGYEADSTLDWHGGHFLKYHGIMGVQVDPRIHGAQLEVRDTRDNDRVETRVTKANQMLVFSNENTEHRVSGIQVDRSDPEKLARRHVVTVGIQARPYTGEEK